MQVQYSTPDFRLFVNHGSVVDFCYPTNQGRSAIVNSANIFCLGGGGVDGAINDAGGESLWVDRASLPVIRHHSDPDKHVRCMTGNAVITGPNTYGRLAIPFVIHAVGPNYSSTKYANREERADVKLANAYKASMALAESYGVESIAFSLLSMGKYRGENRSKHTLLKIAMRTIFECKYEGLKEIHMCGYSQDEFLALVEIAYEAGLPRAEY